MVETCAQIAKYVFWKDRAPYARERVFIFEDPVETTRVENHYWYGPRNVPVKIIKLIVKDNPDMRSLDLFAEDTENNRYNAIWQIGTGIFKIWEVIKENKDYYDIVLFGVNSDYIRNSSGKHI